MIGPARTEDASEEIRKLREEVSRLQEQIQSMSESVAVRERAEARLRDSEERFRTTFELAAVGIAHVAPDGHFILVNPRFCEIVGYSREELKRTNFQSITYPGDLKTNIEYFNSIISGRISTYSLEKRFVRKDGSVVWANMIVVPVPEYEGKPKYLISVIEDITERKRAEEAVRASREILWLILDNIPQRVFWKDLRSVYMGCNTNFAKAAGVGDPEKIAGKTDYDLAWTVAEADAFRRDDREVMDNDCPKYHILEPQKQADGRQSWLDTNKVPLHDADGRVIGILGTYEDITDRKQAEEQIEEAKSQAELYLDLISHDIGNMNQALLGYLEMALDILKPGADEQYLLTQPLEIIHSSSRLISNVRKLKQLRAGEVPPETLDLGQVISDVKAGFPGVPGREITINYVPAEGYTVEANAMLNDLFANLIDNAIRHSRGKLEVGIVVRPVDLHGRTYYRVDVTDNGPGISDQLKQKLLSAIEGGTRKVERRGIGLLLIKALLDRYHGFLRIEDRVPGDYRRGARLVVMLPAIKPPGRKSA